MRPSLLAPICVVLAFGCQREATSTESPKTQPAPGPAGTPQMRVGSAAFHLEVGGVYERFGDRKSAIDHLSQAAALAQDRAERVQAYSALGRLKEAAGDRDGAIDALEQALAKMEEPKLLQASAGPALTAPLSGPGGDDVLFRLARLYVEKGAFDQARLLCERGLSAAREPWQREQFYRFEVELDRKAGTLDKVVAEKEKELDQAEPDESVLRFLAIALGVDGMPSAAVPVGPEGRPQAVSEKLVRIYQRLYEAHPDDLQLRQNLQSLLERAGRIEEAVKLAAAPPPLSPMECEAAIALWQRSPTLRGAVEAIRVRARTGPKERTLAETARIMALHRQEGIAAYLAGAQLYLDQGEAERANRAIERAAREARSREDRRQVAFLRERATERAGRAAELKVIHEQWMRSDDPCLRLAASQREQRTGMMAAKP